MVVMVVVSRGSGSNGSSLGEPEQAPHSKTALQDACVCRFACIWPNTENVN